MKGKDEASASEPDGRFAEVFINSVRNTAGIDTGAWRSQDWDSAEGQAFRQDRGRVEPGVRLRPTAKVDQRLIISVTGSKAGVQTVDIAVPLSEYLAVRDAEELVGGISSVVGVLLRAENHQYQCPADDDCHGTVLQAQDGVRNRPRQQIIARGLCRVSSKVSHKG